MRKMKRCNFAASKNPHGVNDKDWPYTTKAPEEEPPAPLIPRGGLALRRGRVIINNDVLPFRGELVGA